MLKTTTFLFLFFLSHCLSYAQLNNDDTTKTLEGVVVRAFEQNRASLLSTANVRKISPNSDAGNKTSYLQSFNAISGVRMEERSPGSYRINIRGSSLRSPFGVRNVKVYWNDIPVTDPGGNTYFNQFAVNNFSGMEIFKGPAGSLYGAGTGGLILMHTLERFRPGASIEYLTGSYGLHNILASASFGKNETRNLVSFAHNQSEGYRVQSAMRRDNLSWTSSINYLERQQLTASILFTDMEYETPGALTLPEFNNDPSAARPAAGAFPSAVDAKAAIYQKNILAGLTNSYWLHNSLKNVTSLFGAFAQVKNAAIRNYERRNEPHFGGRTSFIYNTTASETIIQLVAGGEFQQAYFNTQVADNRNGNPDTLQTNDDVNLTALTAFVQGDFTYRQNWILTIGASLNYSKVGFGRLSEYPVVNQERKYRNEIAPRISLLRKIGEGFVLLGTFSQGFSPPTIAELLPSTGTISTELEAEKGNNYEMTLRYELKRSGLYFEATGFYFQLRDALVQRRDLSGADFFVNAGKVNQKGIELHGRYARSLPSSRWVEHFSIMADYTYNHFIYDEFVKGTDDFTGNKVPSVPMNSFSFVANLAFRPGFYASFNLYTASGIYLNDANTAIADGYELLGARIGWKKMFRQKNELNMYAGADNLLDQVYSLGNDINAAANRFYNAAPGRNFYVGILLNVFRF